MRYNEVEQLLKIRIVVKLLKLIIIFDRVCLRQISFISACSPLVFCFGAGLSM